MNRLFSILIISSFLTGCFGGKSTFDKIVRLEKFGEPIKLEYYKRVQGKAFQYSDTATFVITDKQELKAVIDKIEHADNPEPWKGAGWNRIKIYYADTILNLNTNNKKIGISASGTFYDLDKENFIIKRTNEK